MQRRKAAPQPRFLGAHPNLEVSFSVSRAIERQAQKVDSFRAVPAAFARPVAKLSPESRAVLHLCAWYADTPIPRVLVMDGATEVLALAEAFGPVAPLSGPAAAELRMRDALTGLARYSIILDATNTTFRVHSLVQTVELVFAIREGTDRVARANALARLSALFP